MSAQVGSYIGGVDVFKNTKGAYIEFKQVKLKAGSGISLQDSTLAVNPSITINAPALANGDKGHILVSMAGTTWLLDTNSVNRYAISDTAISFAKIVNFDAETLFGNPTGSTDSGRLIHLGDNLFFSNDTLHATGGGGSMPDGDYGDVTISGGSTVITINTDAVTTALINNDAVTFAKMQNLLSHTFIGRYSGTTGDPQTVHIGRGIQFSNDTVLVNESDFVNIDQTSINGLISDLSDKMDIADSNVYYYPYYTNPHNYLIGTDTISLSNRINLKLNSSDTSSLSNRINLKMSYSDTSSISNRIDLKLNSSDTSSLSNRIDLKLNYSDTSSLSNRINTKLSYTDTVSISNRINYKLNASDTASLSNRINLKLNSYDTASLSNRIDTKLNISDSTTYYPYHTNPKSYLQAADISGKLNISDSTVYYPYASNPKSYLVAADINGKLNISDTASMLDPYFRKADTSHLMLPIQTGTTGYLSLTRLNTTGTPSSSTYLRGDSTWATVSGSGLSNGDHIDIDYYSTGDSLKIDTNAVKTINIQDGAITLAKLNKSIITPSQITSDQDNYNPTGFGDADIIRISGDNGIRAITSFAAQSDGEVKTIYNVGSYPIYIPGEHPDGTAANRVYLGEDFILFPKQSIELTYDVTLSRWIKTSHTIGSYTCVEYLAVGGDVTAGDHNVVNFAQSGTGATSTATGTSTSNRYPSNSLSTGTTTTGIAIQYMGRQSTTGYFGNSHLSFEDLIVLNQLSNGTDSFTVSMTIGNSASTTAIDQANSIGFKYSHGLYGGKWEGFTRNNANTETTFDTGITVAANTIYKLRVEIDKSLTEARFYINESYVGRLTSGLPNATSNGCKIAIKKGVGTTNASMYNYKMYARNITP